MKRQKGFTLIELLLYMGLFSLLTIVITDILVAALDIQIGTGASNSVVQDGRYIYSRFIYDVNRAESVAIPANLGDTANSLQFVMGGVTYTYSVDNENLMLTSPTGDEQLNSYDTKISNLSFVRIGNPPGKHTFRINVTVTSRSSLRGNPEVKNFQTTAGLR